MCVYKKIKNLFLIDEVTQSKLFKFGSDNTENQILNTSQGKSNKFLVSVEYE